MQDGLTGGSNNVVIGHNADTHSTQSSNQIVIGKGAKGQTDDSVTLVMPMWIMFLWPRILVLEFTLDH